MLDQKGQPRLKNFEKTIILLGKKELYAKVVEIKNAILIPLRKKPISLYQSK